METLLFFIICTMLISVLLGFANTQKKIQIIDNQSYQDDQIESIYAS